MAASLSHTSRAKSGYPNVSSQMFHLPSPSSRQYEGFWDTIILLLLKIPWIKNFVVSRWEHTVIYLKPTTDHIPHASRYATPHYFTPEMQKSAESTIAQIFVNTIQKATSLPYLRQATYRNTCKTQEAQDQCHAAFVTTMANWSEIHCAENETNSPPCSSEFISALADKLTTHSETSSLHFCAPFAQGEKGTNDCNKLIEALEKNTSLQYLVWKCHKLEDLKRLITALPSCLQSNSRYHTIIVQNCTGENVDIETDQWQPLESALAQHNKLKQVGFISINKPLTLSESIQTKVSFQ